MRLATEDGSPLGSPKRFNLRTLSPSRSRVRDLANSCDSLAGPATGSGYDARGKWNIVLAEEKEIVP